MTESVGAVISNVLNDTVRSVVADPGEPLGWIKDADTLAMLNQVIGEDHPGTGDAPKVTEGAVVADGGGLRHNAGKLRVELLPVEWIWALGDVMTVGSQKYAVRNWERGMKWSIVVGCTLRHLFKFIAGERYDQETGCHHLAMAAWNILALMTYDLREIGENDLMQVGMDVLEKVHQEDTAASLPLVPRLPGARCPGCGVSMKPGASPGHCPTCEKYYPF